MRGATARPKWWKRSPRRSTVTPTRSEFARLTSTTEPHDENVHAPLNTIDERVQQEVGQLESCPLAPLRVLQLLQKAYELEWCDSSDGFGTGGSGVDDS